LDPTYSIVVPAYNESARLGASLEKILTYVARQRWSAEVEVIVVNDGSRDDTAEIVRRLAKNNPGLRLVENPGNRGKGYSVRNGMLQSRGRVVVFSDADLSSPIEELPKLLNALSNGADIAIGSRWLQAELQTKGNRFIARSSDGFSICCCELLSDCTSRIRSAASRLSNGRRCRRFFRYRKSSAGDSTLKFFFSPASSASVCRKFPWSGPTAAGRGSILSPTARVCSGKCCASAGMT